MIVVKFKYPGRRKIGIVTKDGKPRSFHNKELAEYFAETLNSMIGPDMKSKMPLYYVSELSDDTENFALIDNTIKEATVG